MLLRNLLKLFLSLVILLTSNSGVYSEEVIVTNAKRSANDSRSEYPLRLLRLALQRTEDEYGPFRIEPYPGTYSRKRGLKLLLNGDIDVYPVATRPEWEEAAIPIRIPLRKGLLGYKLLLIRQGDEDKFAMVNTVEDLKKYRLGSGLQWSTSKALRRLGFDIHGTTEYEPLFAMLMGKRFDYFPRGVNEAFRETDLRKHQYPKLKVEETLLLYLPLPTYLFVTPKRPDLAERLTKGLTLMIEDKTLDREFFKFHEVDLKRAKLHKRRLIRLENLNLSPHTPFNQKHLWLQPVDVAQY